MTGQAKMGKRVLTAAGIILLMLVGLASGAAEQLTIGGSSTVKPIVEAAVPAFKIDFPAVQIVVGGGGSSGGIENAAAGKVMIGMASRNLKDKEKTAFPDLSPVVIGKDGVAIIVHKNNPIDNITPSQIQAIFTGAISSWKEIGGADTAIDSVGILLHHGTAEVFMNYFDLEAEETGEGAKKGLCYWKKGQDKQCKTTCKGMDGNQPACAAVITNPGAISFTSIGFAQALADKGAPLKLIKLDGKTPTAANVVADQYPLSRPLLVMTKGDATGVAKSFIDYLLSANGQKIVAEKGYIPVK